MSKRHTALESIHRTPIRPRVIITVMRSSGLGPCAVVFALLFVLAALIVRDFEPGIRNFYDAAWLMFQAVTTIGFGDYRCVSVVGRGATIALSLYSIFFIALITAAMVNYCAEVLRCRRDESVARFLHQLEHLPELSHDELEDLSRRVRKLR